MSASVSAQRRRLLSAVGYRTREWLRSLALATAVCLAYYVVARATIAGLAYQHPAKISAFWPAAGISSGLLIALGPWARWPLAAGVMVAESFASLGGGNLWKALAYGVCDATEPVMIAGLITHYFGAEFTLDRFRNVLGLLAATIVGCLVSSLGAAVASRLILGPSAQFLGIWQNWFPGTTVGVVTVAPLIIGLATYLRKPPPGRELVEGAAALGAIAATTGGMIFWLPAQAWASAMPAALLLPVLLWLAARCRPALAAAGAFISSLTVVWATLFGIGHFGDPSIPVGDLLLQTQAVILVVTIAGIVLAALFAERRDGEARLALSNRKLERTRDDRLMSLDAVVASISHEIRQPLTAVTTNGEAALLLLERASPDLEEARSALHDIVGHGHRMKQILNDIRALFSVGELRQESIDVNEVALGALRALHGELNDHGVTVDVKLTSELPPIMGHQGQLQEVIINLVHNAIEAMDVIDHNRRVLTVRTGQHNGKSVAVDLEDSGPGIDPKVFATMFDAFVTTKPRGTGLGLAICRTIVERHGGQLSARSDGKSGTLFRLILPTASEATAVAA